MGAASTKSRPEMAPASTFGAEMINSSGDLENATNPSGLRAESSPNSFRKVDCHRPNAGRESDNANQPVHDYTTNGCR
jgi:hypothetical protein